MLPSIWPLSLLSVSFGVCTEGLSEEEAWCRLHPHKHNLYIKHLHLIIHFIHAVEPVKDVTSTQHKAVYLGDGAHAGSVRVILLQSCWWGWHVSPDEMLEPLWSVVRIWSVEAGAGRTLEEFTTWHWTTKIRGFFWSLFIELQISIKSKERGRTFLRTSQHRYTAQRSFSTREQHTSICQWRA